MPGNTLGTHTTLDALDCDKAQWQVAKEMKKPVQLLWTREDDMQRDFYRPYSYHRMSGGLDTQNNIVAWSHRVVSTPIRAVFDPPETLKDPKHVASQELGGADVIPYLVSNFRLWRRPLGSATRQLSGPSRPALRG